MVQVSVNDGDNCVVEKFTLCVLFLFDSSNYNDVPYVGVYRFLEPAIVLRDPELIKDVLIKDFMSFDKNDTFIDGKRDPLLKHNPFFLTGEEWKRSRNLLVPLFTASKVLLLMLMAHYFMVDEFLEIFLRSF